MCFPLGLVFDLYDFGVGCGASNRLATAHCTIFGGVFFTGGNNFAVASLKAPAPTTFAFVYFKLCRTNPLLLVFP